jgi:hypothetical protein
LIQTDLPCIFMNTQGGMQSILPLEIAWRTDRAAKPLLCHEDLLVAQTEPPVGQQGALLY